MKNNLHKYKEVIELSLTSIIFISLILNNSIFPKIDFFNIVYGMLAFIIILEIVRMIGQYIFENHIKLRSVIDTFIIFTLRETILVYSDKTLDKTIKFLAFSNFSLEIHQKLFYILIGLGIMTSLFYFRRKAMEESPNETNCQKCIAKDFCSHQ